MAMITEWESFNLNQSLQENIKSLYGEPTEIQQKVLVYTAAKVDLLIQARTGEGKTLCYGIPIINYLLNCYSRHDGVQTKLSPSALILVPTRELGIQVKNHLEKVLFDKETQKNLHNIIIANVLGGFAKPKQIKVLNKLNPEIIIATPGRLWEIIENEESPLLEKLISLKFLVIDEADRMTEKGHFVELKNIIDHVYNRIELKRKNDKDDDGKEKGKKRINAIQSEMTLEEDKEENEKLAKKLNVDIDKIETIDPLELFPDEVDYNEELEIEKGEEEEDDNDNDNNNEEDNNLEINEGENDEELDDDDGESIGSDQKDIEDNEEDNKNLINFRAIEKEKRKEILNIELNPYVSMRTFLCSATIDQIHQENPKSKSKSKSKSNKKHKEKQSSLSSEEQHFQKLIRNLKFYNKLIYLKLKNQKSNLITSAENSKDNQHQQHQSKEENYDSTVQILPEKLEMDCYKCDPSTKDYYLFHILKENKDKRIMIFTNSISHTKKLYSIFSYFNEFKCTVLHSKMLQNARINNLERFASNKINVLFCTDIGARGLDIPFVDLVLHYHIPQKSETFVHRSGRTARANRSGKVTSLITQKELMLYKKVMIDLHYTQFAMKTLSIVQLEKIKSLFEYAKQIEREAFQIKKANREKQWYKKTAQQCDMIFDDEENRGENEENEDKEEKAQKKFLNKKRNLQSKEKLNQKKIYTKINESAIKRTSYLTPELVKKWNTLIKESNFQNENLTQALHQAHNDARVIRFKDKPKKKRYQRRRNR